MSRYLLTYSDNWADEIDLDGHVVLTEKEYLNLKKSLEQCNGFCFTFGSNQDIEYDDGIEAECVIDVRKITEEEYKVLKKLDLLSVGFAGKFIDQLMESIDDEDSFNITREELEELSDDQIKEMAEDEFDLDVSEYQKNRKLNRNAIIDAILATQEEEDDDY